MNYREWNRQAWNKRMRDGGPYVDTASNQDFLQPREAIDAFGWLPVNLADLKILCLAAGGGRHGVLLAALGGRVTVVDLSEEMLEADRKIARERNLEIQLVQGSIEDLSGLPESHFDLIVQPVSSCYVERIQTVFQEAARVSRGGALFISHHKQPASLQSALDRKTGRYYLAEPYYRIGPLPPAEAGSLHREEGTVEFLHSWSDLVGALCRSGFVIEDLREPRHGKADAPPGSFAHRAFYAPPFFSVKARRVRG